MGKFVVRILGFGHDAISVSFSEIFDDAIIDMCVKVSLLPVWKGVEG